MIITYKRILDFFRGKFKTNVQIIGDKRKIKIGRGVEFLGRVIIDLSHDGEVNIGDNVVLMEGVILKPFGGKIIIGNNCSINPYCVLYGHGGLTIGNYVRIATHTIIIPANHIIEALDIPVCEQGLSTKGIIIEEDVWIGAGVKILDGVKIEKGSVLAAGAVINSNVEQYSIYGGVPGRLIKKRY
ncbi:acyltransferase [Echinicola salinicaeni]|uniref:acyltransferase n=1 Tax=Echinicola salinicaeni TaxID=2762757 RepID=UPI001C973F53|nr:acyltransferase [Echinicola salinicaeni]